MNAVLNKPCSILLGAPANIGEEDDSSRPPAIGSKGAAIHLIFRFSIAIADTVMQNGL
jgi:hypothetical protein